MAKDIYDDDCEDYYYHEILHFPEEQDVSCKHDGDDVDPQLCYSSPPKSANPTVEIDIVDLILKSQVRQLSLNKKSFYSTKKKKTNRGKKQNQPALPSSKTEKRSFHNTLYSDRAHFVYKEIFSNPEIYNAQDLVKRDLSFFSSGLNSYDLSIPTAMESLQLQNAVAKPVLRRNHSSPGISSLLFDEPINPPLSCDSHHDFHLRKMYKVMASIMNDGNNEFRESVIGPDPRGSMVVKCPLRRAAVAVIWKVPTCDHNFVTCSNYYDNISNVFSLRVIPLVGCEWKDTQVVQEKVLNLLASKNIYNNIPGKICQVYWELSHEIIRLQENISNLLEEFLPHDPSMQNFRTSCHNFLVNSLKKNNLHVSGKALDRYDLLGYLTGVDAQARIYNQKCLWNGTLPTLLQRVSEVPPRADSFYRNDHCLICFEEFDKASKLKSDTECIDCGHRVCAECWRGYLHSAASNGDIDVKCPAFECKTRISILDVAHICFLGSGHAVDMDDDTAVKLPAIFKKLVQYRLERYIPTVPSFSSETKVKTKFCKNPKCGRILVAGNSFNEDGRSLLPGSSMYICPCGTTSCASCAACEDKSHFGLSCTEFLALANEMNSGRLKADIQSAEWVKKHSKPCPQCCYPIEKHSGCNHMRCTQCQYYFCWECGGSGSSCMAYECAKVGGVWANQVKQNRKETAISPTEEFFGRLKIAEAKLRSFEEKQFQHASTFPSELVIERQLYQVLVWLYTIALERVTKADVSQNAPDEFQGVRDQIEVVIHTLSLRHTATSLNVSPVSVITNSRKETSNKTNMEFGIRSDPLFHPSIGGKQHSKRKMQSLKAKENRVDGYRKMIVDKSFGDLCSQTDSQFKTSTRKAIFNAIREIKQSLESKQVDSKKKSERAGENNELDGLMRKNNLKGKQPAKHPWSMGMTIDKSKGCGARNVGEVRKTFWKGKLAAKERKHRTREKYSIYQS